MIQLKQIIASIKKNNVIKKPIPVSTLNKNVIILMFRALINERFPMASAVIRFTERNRY